MVAAFLYAALITGSARRREARAPNRILCIQSVEELSMNKAQGAAATGDAEGTPQTPLITEEPLKQGQTQSLRDAVLGNLELPAEIFQPAKEKAQGEPKAKPKGPEEEEEEAPGEAEIPQEEIPPEEPTQEEPEPAATAPVPEEWPASAKARVAEEAEKRRQRTEELNAWKAHAAQLNAVAQQLQAQLQQAANQPTPEEPLRDVTDFGQLQYVKTINENLEDFCEANPDGADNVVIGRDEKGQEISRDYTAEEIRAMKVHARAQLRAVPVREAYLQALQANFQAAQQVYPEMFQEGTPENRAAIQILMQRPDLKKDPDFHLAIGHYIEGYKSFLAKQAKRNGQAQGGKQLRPGAQAILNQPELRKAPAVARRATPDFSASERGGKSGGEVKQAREEFVNSGLSDEGLEKFVTAKLARGAAQRGRGSKEPLA
jgi:hypothetical protein